MSRIRGTAPAAALLSGALLWGCGNGGVPTTPSYPLSGQVSNQGPISLVVFRQVIDQEVVSPTNSSVNVPVVNGSFSIPAAPQGLYTLEFRDARQVPWGYSEVYVQPGQNAPPATVIGPGPVPSPDPAVNGGVSVTNPSATPGAPAPGYTGYVDPTTPGKLTVRAFLQDGSQVAAKVQLFNVNVQGGPSGSVGQNPGATNPGLVSGTQAGETTGTNGASTSTATTGAATAGTATAGTTTAGTATTGATTSASTAGSSTTGSTAGTTGTGSTGGTGTGDSGGGSGGGSSRQASSTVNTNPINNPAVSSPFIFQQEQILATVTTNTSGVVSISGIPTGAPELVTPGGESQVTSTTDANGNVTLRPAAGQPSSTNPNGLANGTTVAASTDPTGGEYQLVPVPIPMPNGQILYARQVFLEVEPGATTNVDLLYTPMQ